MLFYLLTFYVIIVAEAQYRCPGGQLSEHQRKRIVVQINRFRWQLAKGKLKNKDGKYMPKGKNILKMRYDCELEKSAQDWADRCIFAHSPKGRGRDVGENVYSLSSYESVEGFKESGGTDAGEYWWSELQQHYTDNPSNKLTWDVPCKTLHFTQMAWGKTHKIGCGIATHCNGGRTLMVICHYSPAGNVRQALIYELGEPCKTGKDCYTGKCSKSGGLCKI